MHNFVHNFSLCRTLCRICASAGTSSATTTQILGKVLRLRFLMRVFGHGVGGDLGLGLVRVKGAVTLEISLGLVAVLGFG